MSDIKYDVIVIGGGVIGSSTGYHLAKNGKKTLILEQFPAQHSLGSSHGHSRITRLAYPKEIYTDMMADAFRILNEIEEESETKIYTKCGHLSIGEKNGQFLKSMRASLERCGGKHECISSEALKIRFPMMSHPDNVEGVLDIKGGIIKADYYLRAVQSIFVKLGGQIRDSEPVLEIHPGSPDVTVKTSKASYTAETLVIAAGPWSEKILQPIGVKLPLQTLRISVGYWKEREPGSHSPGKFPCFTDQTAGKTEYEFWGIPSAEYPGYAKVALHYGPEISPDMRDRTTFDWVMERVSSYIKEHLPGLETTPSIVQHCIYTNTPDKDFIIDFHPLHKNIIIAAGFSGHGFKLAPAVGHAVSDMASGNTPKYNMSKFKIDRFLAV